MLYMGLSLTSIWTLQLIKNVAAQIILGSPGMVHVTPLLHELHWLQVCFWSNSRYWSWPLKPYMAGWQVTCRTIFVPLYQPIPLGQIGRVCCTCLQLKNFNWWIPGRDHSLPLLLAFGTFSHQTEHWLPLSFPLKIPEDLAFLLFFITKLKILGKNESARQTIACLIVTSLWI